MGLQLRIQSIPRDPAVAVPGAEGEGAALVRLVRDTAARGAAPPAAVVHREKSVDIVYLAPLSSSGVNPGRLLSALTRSRLDDGPEPEGVGLIGQFRLHPDGRPEVSVPMVQVFLEWPDCSWWHWRALLDADGTIRSGTETEHAARLGDPLPAGLGRWWSTGRRHRMRLELRREAEPVQALVH